MSLKQTLVPVQDVVIYIVELYVETCSDIIERHGGTVGDWNEHQIVAFWTDRTKDHAERACRAVIEQREALQQLSL